MTASTPQDVAIAFRSFPRRLSGLLGDASDDAQRSAAGPMVTELEELVRETARRMGVPASGDAADVAAGVADAIDSRPADAWTDADLEAVRSAALEGGHLLRLIEGALSD